MGLVAVSRQRKVCAALIRPPPDLSLYHYEHLQEQEQEQQREQHQQRQHQQNHQGTLGGMIGVVGIRQKAKKLRTYCDFLQDAKFL